MCTARVDFKWQPKDQKYLRDEGQCHIFHDHCVQFRSVEHIDQEVYDIIKKMLLKGKITASEICRQLLSEHQIKIMPFEATFVIRQSKRELKA